MARVKEDATEPVLEGMPETAGDATEVERRKVPKELRPVFTEIARLSATLGLARTACYAGDPVRARDALKLLGRRVPDAVETAELVVPYEE